jgi:hypothetical protein
MLWFGAPMRPIHKRIDENPGYPERRGQFERWGIVLVKKRRTFYARFRIRPELTHTETTSS